MFSLLILSCSFAIQSSAAKLDPLSLDFKLQQQADFAKGAETYFKLGIKPSTWADVKSWQAVGDRFAAAYNQNGTMIAIYDLSYPTRSLPTVIGKISGSQKDTASVLTAFTAAQAKVNQSDLSTEVKKSITALNHISAITDAAYLHADWWKNLPWKNRALVASAPASFRLTDLDLSKLRINSGLSSGLRKLFQIVLNDSGDLDSLDDSSIFNAFQFVRTSDGGLEMQWSDPRAGVISRPRKLLDFVNTRTGLYDNIKVEAIASGLSQMTSLIPIPVVSALVSTAISRVKRYYLMTQTEHLEMLHEMLIETNEPSIQDPVLSQLSQRDLKNMVNAFEWKRVVASDAWRWIFTNPDKAWAKGQQNDLDVAARAKSWLNSNGQNVTDLNDRFSFGTTTSNAKSLYLDSATFTFRSKRPAVSIDYSNPSAIAKQRLVKEWGGLGLEFGSKFVPVAGFAITTAYGFLVQNVMDEAENWEARLIQHLESRPENWDVELSILQNQRINPFEIGRDEIKQLIQARRLLIGL